MSNLIAVDVIEFEQYVGIFLLAVMEATDLIRISRANPRKYDAEIMDTVGGIQRGISKKRVKEIAAYANTVDATFPTPILLAINEKDFKYEGNKLEIIGDHVADIVDGQHRIEGLRLSNVSETFKIPVVFILNPTVEQKALIFAIINGKQTKVPASLIYELFGLTKKRSPQKAVHEIARALNNTPDSPWFKRLKMLGIKTPGSLESLSQGTFVKHLLPCISKKADFVRNEILLGNKPPEEKECVFNEYFRNKDDSTILKILMNVYEAAKNTWPIEWDDPNSYTLTKTQGFTGIMKAIPMMVEHGKQNQDLSVKYFTKIFQKTKELMDTKKITFTVESFPSSAVGESAFRDIIIEALRNFT